MAVTRTPITPNPGGVVVSPAAGEYLRFTVEAAGPLPIFTFASSAKGVLYQAADFIGHPMMHYEWLHLKNPSDIQQDEGLDIGLAFFANANYTYTVELWNGAGLVSTVLKANFVGAPTDRTDESFTVVIA